MLGFMRIYVAAWESRRSKGTSWLVVILNIVVPVARLGIATALPLLARARLILKYHIICEIITRGTCDGRLR